MVSSYSPAPKRTIFSSWFSQNYRFCWKISQYLNRADVKTWKRCELPLNNWQWQRKVLRLNKRETVCSAAESCLSLQSREPHSSILQISETEKSINKSSWSPYQGNPSKQIITSTLFYFLQHFQIYFQSPLDSPGGIIVQHTLPDHLRGTLLQNSHCLIASVRPKARK